MGLKEIVNLCADMTLLEMERSVQRLQVGLMTAAIKRLLWSLVGNVLTSKMVNRDGFASVLKKIWRVNKGVEIECVTNNVFMFQFRSATN
ncbi:hypothetical protein LWI29_037207 [Acer saccharum]|uniref:Uncharacterized protein n=1 Tax=Acer saccharum TaxID=4024 RepID=A0AA39RG06_ACESA|nr:hypothetical protein LWI29_037207 [Acer saccharum]